MRNCAKLLNIEELSECRYTEVEFPGFWERILDLVPWHLLSKGSSDHIVDRSKTRSSCDEYLWSIGIFEGEGTRDSSDTNTRSKREFSNDSASSALFRELDEEGEPLSFLLHDRVVPDECSTEVFPEEGHELSGNTRDKFFSLNHQLKCRLIERVLLDDGGRRG